MKNQLKNIISLTAVCAVAAVLLAIVNYFTAPIIEETERKAAMEALSVVLPDGGNFTEIDIANKKLPETITEAYAGENGGYVFRTNVSGYAKSFIIMCGVSQEGEITGIKTISSGETLGYEKTYGENLLGLDKDGIAKADIISGATKTTEGMKKAASDAISAYEILKGGK